MTPIKEQSVNAQLYFLTPLPKYQTEKPYTLRYLPPPSSSSASIPQTNISRTMHTLTFNDMRAHPELRYNKCGFMKVECKSVMQYEDYEDAEMVGNFHQRKVEEVVKQALMAEGVEILDWVIRRRDPNWPIATGATYKFQQPASAAHIDHTYEAGKQMIRAVHGSNAEQILSRKWQFVNAWHPLSGPLSDWPLALCDASTVDFEKDTMAGDVVDRDAVFENTQVCFGEEQKWYYLPDQEVDEILIFKNADGATGRCATAGVPHASFDNPLKREGEKGRESVEFRMLVWW